MLDERQMNILQRNTLIQSLSVHSKWFFQIRHFLILLMGLQLVWLAAIGLTGAHTNWTKLIFLIVYSVIATAGVALLPTPMLSKVGDLNEWLLRKEKRVFLVLGLAVLIVGILYAFNQRMWTNERHFFAAGEIVAAEGMKGLTRIYSEMSVIRYQHPPLIPILYGLILNLLGGNLFTLRLVSVIFLIATVMITYLLGRELYNRATGLLASLFLLTFPLVIRLGSSALMDIELAFFFSLGVLLCLRLLRKPSYGLAVAFGCVIGIGLLTKYMMFFFYGVLLGYAVISPSFRKLKNYLLTAVLISVCLFSIWVFYAYQVGILSGQIARIANTTGIFHVAKEIEGEEEDPVITDSQASNSNRSTVPVRMRIMRLGLESLLTRLPSSLGVHHAPLILLGGIYLIRRRAQSDWFVLLWIGIVSFILIVTLPGHRYFLSIFPAIAILMARFFHINPRLTERAVLLSLLFSAANLYLFVDWARESTLFISPIP